MEQDGLIESETEPSEGRGPSRKVYSITKNGKKEWEQTCMEMLETIAEPDRDSASFLLGLSVLPVLPKRKVLAALKENVEQLKTRASYLSERMEGQEFLPAHIKVMFDYSQNVLDAKRKWVEEFMEKVKVGEVF
jgi:DNA-binding PadR family transcriptional regulator